MSNFKGKAAIVTGGTKGIGAACVRLLYERGAGVIAVYGSDKAAAEALAAELAFGGNAAVNFGNAANNAGENAGDNASNAGKAVGQVDFMQVDVSNIGDIERLMAFATERYGGLDILVNNAGIMQSTSIEDMTEDEWDRVLAINLKSVFFVTQKALPLIKARGGGKIVNMTSLAGRNGGFVNGLAYTASKAGIVGLTKGFAARLAPFGINVNAVAPGTTDTGILDGISEEKMAGLMAKIPAGRLGTPEEIAAATVFLCSDKADFITGAVLDINGGMYFA